MTFVGDLTVTSFKEVILYEYYEQRKQQGL